MALTFAIVLGITSSLGSLLPLLVQNPAELFSRRGQVLLAGLALVILGIILCSKAGALRERAQNPQAVQRRGTFTGLLICIASGVLSPALNFGFVFGEPLKRKRSGAAPARTSPAMRYGRSLWAADFSSTPAMPCICSGRTAPGASTRARRPAAGTGQEPR